ncbi:phosphodiester glycosidase family protein [Agrobacterium larrymoorei]|uniref:phosphodiester glycosidase family protein n=1 Tax=Agrobacterium larrymoorei TaxID=160699 RepID=UPI0030BBAB0D
MRRLAIYFSSLFLATQARGSELPSYCLKMEHVSATYTVCSFDPETADIRLYSRDDVNGTSYGGFAALSSALWRQHQFIVFAMNGGMYHRDLSPVGLFIDNKIEKKSISIAGGWGNFHMQPNGVFFIADGKAGVRETSAYLNANLKPDTATQSGPMLVIDGKLHPRFLADSDSFKRRNGVGVSSDGVVHFAISEDPVRFYDFATLFRDRLKSDNALYLDGTISSVDIPAMGRRDDLFPMGPIIAVVDKVPDL